MPPPPEQPASPPDPRSLFDRFLADRKEGRPTNFEDLCRDHAGHEPRLRMLFEEWQRSNPAEHQKMKEEEPSVSLAPELGTDQNEASMRLLKRVESHSPRNFHYKIEGEIARGGMGAIIKAWDQDLRRELAMKVILGDDGPAKIEPGSKAPSVNARALGRFLEEAQVTGQLEHPGIVPVHDMGMDPEGQVYFTMRLVKGRNLREIFRLVKEGKDGWSQTRALGVLLKVCEAMAYAHSKGVIHRDLKPDNVMVGKFGETYVMDWGLAKVVGHRDATDIRIDKERVETSTNLVLTLREDEEESGGPSLKTMDGDVVGTPAYMPPEQAHGDLQAMGPHSDVYAIGAILYHLLAGFMPYAPPGSKMTALKIWEAVKRGGPKPLAKINNKLPVELVSICEKAMARDPQDRYPDMMAMAEDMRAYMENRVVKAHSTGALAEFKKWVGRNKGIAGAMAAVVLVAVGALVWVNLVQAKANEDLLEANEKEKKSRAEADQARDEAVLAQQKAEEEKKKAVAALDLAEERRIEADAAREKAEAEKKKAKEALARFQAQLLISQAGDSLQANPALAWLLAEEGARREPSELATNTLLDAIRACREIGLLQGHEGSVESAAFSPVAGDMRVVTAARDGTLRVWDAVTHKTLHTLRGHGGPVWQASFDRQGKRIVSASADGTARVWDAATGQELVAPMKHGGPVIAASFSQNGSQVLTVSEDGSARIWDASAGREVQVLTQEGALWAAFSQDGRQATVGTVNTTFLKDAAGQDVRTLWDIEAPGVFHPDGETFATFQDKQAHFWDTKTDVDNEYNSKSGKEYLNNIRHDKDILNLSFDREGQRLITASSDKSARVWNYETGELLVELKGHDAAVLDARFSADGQYAVTASADGTARVWELEQPRLRVSFCESFVLPGAGWFSPDGSVMLHRVLENGRTVWTLREPATGITRTRLKEVSGDLLSAALSPDGKVLATTQQGRGSVELWDPATGESRGELLGRDQGVRSAWFDPRTGHVLTTAGDSTARIYDPATGREVLTLQTNTPVVDGVMSPDGSLVALCSAGKQVSLWSASDGSALRTLGSGLDLPRFSPDGSMIATRANRSVVVWDSRSGQRLATLADFHNEEVISYQFSPNDNGARIVTASRDGVRVWNTRSGAKVCDVGTAYNTGAGFNHDGTLVITPAGDNDPRVWNAATGTLVRTFGDHEATLHPVAQACAATGTFLTAEKRTARVWDPRTGKQVANALRDPSIRLRWAALAPGGQRAVTVSDDGMIRIWKLEQDQQNADLLGLEGGMVWKTVKEIESGEGAVQWAAFSADGSRVLTRGASARVWNADTGAEFASLEGVSRNDLSPPVFSPDGSRLVAVSNWPRQLPGAPAGTGESQTIRVWNSATRRVAAILEGAHHLTQLPAFSSDGTKVLAVSEGAALVFDAASGSLLHRIDQEPVASASFSRDGAGVVTTAPGGTSLTMWELGNGTAVRRLAGHEGPVHKSRLSPDGRLIASVSADRTARLWNTATGAAALPPLQHEENVIDAAFSPDSTRLATVTSDNRVHLWDTASGKLLAARTGWGNAFFSPDGRFLVTSPREVAGNYEGWLWPVDPLSYSKSHRPRGFTPEEIVRLEIPQDD